MKPNWFFNKKNIFLRSKCMPPILNLNPFIIKKHTQKTNEINKQQQNKTTSTDSNRVPLVEQELHTFPEHLSSPVGF